MHRSYPTPSNPKLDINSNHKAEILKPASLQTMHGPDLLEINSIAEFWAWHHGRGEHNKNWKPIHKRVQKEILRRLEVGRTSAILDKKDVKQWK